LSWSEYPKKEKAGKLAERFSSLERATKKWSRYKSPGARSLTLKNKIRQIQNRDFRSKAAH
jgi:hypothetical protein